MSKLSSFPHSQHGHMKTMLECYTVCSSCAKMCMNEGRKETAAICTDCADICGLAIKLHSGDSEFSKDFSALCSEVCKRCAEVCSQSDSKHCKECSEICRECAKCCLE
jgi:hypothetical protein